MPIVINQLIPANAGQPGYAVARELARQQVAQFGAVRGANAGVGPGSCCAAVAIMPNAPGFPAVHPVIGFDGAGGVGAQHGPVALPYSVVYGNSQMAAGGLVNVQVGGHAERAALTAVANEAQNLYAVANQAVLFVELSPCANCANWLNGAGGGVANPFNGIINGGGGGAMTLNVWFRWSYPGPPALPGMIGGVAPLAVAGAAAMNQFHGWALANQLVDINGPTW